MSLFHLSTPEIEAEVVRLLTELAERRHAGDADRIEVRFLSCWHVASAFNFAPRPERLGPDQSAWERATLAHWLALRPDLDSVTVIVRNYGKIVASLHLDPDAATPRVAFGPRCPAPGAPPGSSRSRPRTVPGPPPDSC